MPFTGSPVMKSVTAVRFLIVMPVLFFHSDSGPSANRASAADWPMWRHDAARSDPVHNSDRQVDLPGAALGALAALSGPSGATLACPDPLWAGFWDPSRSNFSARTLKSEVFATEGCKNHKIALFDFF